MVDALQLMHRAAGRHSGEPCRTLTHMKCTTATNYLPHCRSGYPFEWLYMWIKNRKDIKIVGSGPQHYIKA